LIKERCHLLSDLVEQGRFFFEAPKQLDIESIKGKWNEQKTVFFQSWMNQLDAVALTHEALETSFGDLATEMGIKKGELMLPLRIMLVGGKFGPGVFDIITLIGKEETKNRISSALTQL
jgi:glutamyl-tRNA synthetase